ncbi:hypothetical protein ACOMHN_032793 [Nucella lapillus]
MPRRRNYREEDLQAAIQAVKKGKGLREAARLHDVPPSTIKDRMKGRTPFHEVERTVITTREEDQLVAWIKECARRGYGRSMSQVQRAVQTILNERGAVTVFKDNLPGKKWISLFMKRHRDVSFRTPQALGAQRAAVTVDKITDWFKLAYDEITAAGGVLDDPSRIFNCDETGFQLGSGGFTKIIASKNERVYQVTSDTHTQITVLACVSASGEVLDPLIIFPGKRFGYDPLEGFPEAHFAKSDNGWIDGEIFATWLKTAFIPATNHLPRPVILFLDGHKTHVTMAVSDVCRDKGIILYQLPSHSSHVVQPLDLTTFKPLKKGWRDEVMRFQEAESDTVGKKDFAKLLKVAWKNGIDPDVVISGFRAAGIYPWNPDHVDLTKLGPSRLYATEVTETATEVTETATEVTETEPEVTETAPEVTETATVTVVTDEPVTLNSSPPSPLPPLTLVTDETIDSSPPSPLPSLTLVTDETIDSSPPSPLPPLTVTPPPITTPEASHVNTPSLATVSTASTSNPCFITNRTEALDRLLDITAKAGVDKLIRYRTLNALRTPTDDPEERLFCLLYSKLTQPTDDESKGSTQDKRTFDNLPLPAKWTQNRKRPILQPPKMTGGQQGNRMGTAGKQNGDSRETEWGTAGKQNGGQQGNRMGITEKQNGGQQGNRLGTAGKQNGGNRETNGGQQGNRLGTAGKQNGDNRETEWGQQGNRMGITGKENGGQQGNRMGITGKQNGGQQENRMGITGKQNGEQQGNRMGTAGKQWG